MFDEDTYNDDVKSFTNIKSDEAGQLLETQDKTIVYIGRETCPYCRKFVKKLSAVASNVNEIIYYVNSDDITDKNLSFFRQKYTINTVPGFLVGKKGTVEVKCDSSMSEEQIKDMMQ